MMRDLKDQIETETQIIVLHVRKILADVPMVTRYRNVMEDIEYRCETISSFLRASATERTKD